MTWKKTWAKIALIITAVVVCLPVIIVLTVLELVGMLVDRHGLSLYELSDRRYATLDRAGNLLPWPAGTEAISNFDHGFATYVESTMDLHRPSEMTAFADRQSGGFIDTAGKKYPARMWWFTKNSHLCDGLANVVDPYSGKHCYIGVDGKQALTQMFEAASPFSDGLAAVSVTPEDPNTHVRTWGYIDRSGRFVIPPRYKYAGRFMADRALVSPLKGDSQVVIDKTGAFIFKNSFDTLEDFSSDGVAIFKNHQQKSEAWDWEQCGLVDKNGRVITRGLLYTSFANGVGQIVSSDGAKFANAQGKVVLATKFPQQVSQPYVFGDGLCAVGLEFLRCTGGKYAPSAPRLGFIDHNGIIKITFSGDRIVTAAFPFVNGYTAVKTYIARPD